MPLGDIVRNLLVRLTVDADGVSKDIDKASKQFGALQKNLDKLSSTFTGIGAGLTAGITLPIAGAATAALKFSTDFNAAMANVATLIPGNVARVNELKGSVQTLAVQTGKSTADIAGGLFQVVSAFGDTSDSVKLLEINARAAAAGLASTEDAINLTSAVTKGYGDTSAEAAQKAADLAFKTNELGQTTFPELAASIGRVVPLSAELRVSQEELFGVMATATGVTGNAAEVSTQLRGVLQSLLAPTETMTELFKALGIESGKALIEQRGLQGAIETIAGAAEASGIPLQKLVSSIEGQTLALALAGPQADVFSQKLAAMQSASGSVDKAFKEQAEGVNALGFTFDQFKTRLEVLAQRLGDTLAPAFKTALDVADDLIGALETGVKFFGDMPAPIQTAAIAIAGLAAAFGPILLAMGGLTAAFSSLIGVVGTVTGATGIPAIGAALGALGTAATGPIGIVVLGLTALAAGFTYVLSEKEKLDKNIQETRELTALRNAVEELGVALFQQAGETWPEYQQRVRDTAKELGLFVDGMGAVRLNVAGTNAVLKLSSVEVGKFDDAMAGLNERVGITVRSVGESSKALKEQNPVVKAVGDAISTLGEKTKTTATHKQRLAKVLDEFGNSVRFVLPAVEQLAKTGETLADRLKRQEEAARQLRENEVRGLIADYPKLTDAINDSIATVAEATGIFNTHQVAIEDLGIEAVRVAGAYETLGVKSREAADRDLAKMAEAVEAIRREVEAGRRPQEDLTAAVEAYNKAASGGKQATTFFGEAIKQVSTIINDFAKTFSENFIDLITGRGRREFNRGLEQQSADLREKLAEQESDLATSLAEREEEYRRFVENATATEAEIRAHSAEQLAEALGDLRNNLRERAEAYSEYVQDAERRLSRLSEDITDNIDEERKETKKNIDERKKRYDRDVKDAKTALDRKTRDIEAQIREEQAKGDKANRDRIAALRRRLADEREDFRILQQRKLEDLNAFIVEEQAQLAEFEEDKRKRLERETEDAKIALDRRAADHAAYVDEINRKAQEIREKSAADEVEKLSALQTSLANQTAEYEKFKANAIAEYDKLKSETQIKLDDIAAQHRTFADDVGGLFVTMFTEAGTALTRFVTEYLVGKLFKKLGELVDVILPSVSKALSGVFGNAGGSIPAGGGGGGGGGGGAPPISAGGGAGGGPDPLAIVNTVFSGISAIYSIRQEGTLNAIEENTRALNFRFGAAGVLGTLFLIKEELMFGTFVKVLEQIRDDVRGTIAPALANIATAGIMVVGLGKVAATAETIAVNTETTAQNTATIPELPERIAIRTRSTDRPVGEELLAGSAGPVRGRSRLPLTAVAPIETPTLEAPAVDPTEAELRRRNPFAFGSNNPLASILLGGRNPLTFEPIVNAVQTGANDTGMAITDLSSVFRARLDRSNEALTQINTGIQAGAARPIEFHAHFEGATFTDEAQFRRYRDELFREARIWGKGMT